MLSFTAAALTVALLPAIVHSATKETLQIQIGKDKDILDTVTIAIEYDDTPEVEHPNGVKWADLEKDSLWEDNNGRHVRYNHAFLASMGSRKGYGSDYIDYTKRGNEEPEYSAGVSFIFPGDTLVQFSWEPVHMYFYRQIVPYEETGFVSESEVYGQVSQYVKSGSENLAQGQWAKLLIRENGWSGFETTGSMALRPAKQAGRTDGWIVHLAPGTVLRAPPGATGLKVLDVQGRLHWESRNLREGTLVILPGELPKGVLRYYWQSERG